jgi:hypothetical protein
LVKFIMISRKHHRDDGAKVIVKKPVRAAKNGDLIVKSMRDEMAKVYGDRDALRETIKDLHETLEENGKIRPLVSKIDTSDAEEPIDPNEKLVWAVHSDLRERFADHSFEYTIGPVYCRETYNYEFISAVLNFPVDMRNDFKQNSELKHMDALVVAFKYSFKRYRFGLRVHKIEGLQYVSLELAAQVMNLSNVNLNSPPSEVRTMLSQAIERVVAVNIDKHNELQIQQNTLDYCFHKYLYFKQVSKHLNGEKPNGTTKSSNMGIGKMSIGSRILTTKITHTGLTESIFHEIANVVQCASRWAVMCLDTPIRLLTQHTPEPPSEPSKNEWQLIPLEEKEKYLMSLMNLSNLGSEQIYQNKLRDLNLKNGLKTPITVSQEKPNCEKSRLELINQDTELIQELNCLSKMNPTPNSNMQEEFMPEMTNSKFTLDRGLSLSKKSSIDNQSLLKPFLYQEEQNISMDDYTDKTENICAPTTPVSSQTLTNSSIRFAIRSFSDGALEEPDFLMN